VRGDDTASFRPLANFVGVPAAKVVICGRVAEKATGRHATPKLGNQSSEPSGRPAPRILQESFKNPATEFEVNCDPNSGQQQTKAMAEPGRGSSKKDTEMHRLRRAVKIAKLALIATAVAATTAVSACSISTQAGPTVPGAKPTPTAGPTGGCQVNPET